MGVRGYQGLGGTLGLAGTFEDPGGMRRASLVAGAVIFLAGIGALAFVRPWGLRIPRMLVIGPALAGATYAMAHALTAYITKPLHLGPDRARQLSSTRAPARARADAGSRRAHALRGTNLAGRYRCVNCLHRFELRSGCPNCGADSTIARMSDTANVTCRSCGGSMLQPI